MKLSVENGCFAYKKGSMLLNNINIDARDGEIVAVLGPNGAGKTTFLRCLMGFLRWSRGESTIDNENINAMNERRLWRRMAYVPQAKGGTAAYTAEEMILLGRSSRFGMFARPGDKDVQKVQETLERLHIDRLAKRQCSRLSGGELQMVLMARAIAAEPKILVLDEPESNLDFRNQLLVLQVMSELAAEGMCCVFNTHYPAHALQRAHKALLLDREGNNLFGDVREVVTEANIEKAFGVRAVISEVETPGNTLSNVVPVEVSGVSGTMAQNKTGRRMPGVMAVIAENRDVADRINAALHDYREYIIGRMGMPYEKEGVSIISVMLDAEETVIKAAAQRLGTIPGVKVKITYSPEAAKGGGER